MMGITKHNNTSLTFLIIIYLTVGILLIVFFSGDDWFIVHCPILGINTIRRFFIKEKLKHFYYDLEYLLNVYYLIFRDELLTKILEICSQNDYQYISNFEWYVSVLVELSQMEGGSHGGKLAHQMMDVAIRYTFLQLSGNRNNCLKHIDGFEFFQASKGNSGVFSACPVIYF